MKKLFIIVKSKFGLNLWLISATLVLLGLSVAFKSFGLFLFFAFITILLILEALLSFIGILDIKDYEFDGRIDYPRVYLEERKEW